MEIKKYHAQTVLSDFGNDHGLKRIVESEDGEYYKVEDIEWLFNEKLQINKLNLQDDDIVVVKVSDTKSDERVKKIHDFMCDTFKNRFNRKVEVMTVIENIELGVLKSTHRSNHVNEGD